MATLRVFQAGYCGANSRERVIHPGEYEHDDPALFGLAAFLVENLRAEWLVADDPEPMNTSVDYGKWTVKDLEDFAADRGFELTEGGGSGATGKWLKSDLVELHQLADSEDSGDA